MCVCVCVFFFFFFLVSFFMIPEIYFIKMDDTLFNFVVYFSLNKNSVKPLVLTKKGSDLVSKEGREGGGWSLRFYETRK